MRGVANLLFPAPRSDASPAAAGPVLSDARVDPDGQVLLGNESGQQRDQPAALRRGQTSTQLRLVAI